MIYLDHNASTPIKPQVRAVLDEMLDLHGNPSAIHGCGKLLREKIEESRRQVAKAVNALDVSDVIFTSGATESNMNILHGCVGVDNVLVSAIEHPSVRKSRDDLKFIPVDKNGIVDLIALEAMLKLYAIKEGNTLISIMMVNNETGVIQPIKEITKLVHSYGALMHTDAVQALGRLPVDMQDIGVDALTLSGHKIGAPHGVGVLVVRSGVEVAPLLLGGNQEKRKRAGTENVASIVAFGCAAELAIADLSKCSLIKEMRDDMESKLLEISQEINIFACDALRTANTCFFATPNLDSQALVIALDLDGIAVTAGTACSSGTTHTSTVLEAMGVSPELQRSAIRISLGWNTTQRDIETFLQVWKSIYSRMRS